MRLNPKGKLFNQPVLRVREVVRWAMRDWLWGNDQSELTKKVSDVLQQPLSVSEEVMEQLIKEGYCVQQEKKFHDKITLKVEATDKGRRFGIATANPAITRKKADQLLSDLIERATIINGRKELVYFVENIRVFGSYLSDKKILGDLDVAVKLTRKYDGDELTLHNEERIEEAYQNGRSFSSFIDGLLWPRKEVLLMLKTRKKGLSLHEDDDEVLLITETKTVYEFRNESKD